MRVGGGVVSQSVRTCQDRSSTYKKDGVTLALLGDSSYVMERRPCPM
jgi:hypothetical protein